MVSAFSSAHEPRRSLRLREQEDTGSADSDIEEIDASAPSATDNDSLNFGHWEVSIDGSSAPSSPLPDEYECYFKALCSTYSVLSAEKKHRARVQLKNIIAAELEIK